MSAKAVVRSAYAYARYLPFLPTFVCRCRLLCLVADARGWITVGLRIYFLGD